MPTGTPGGRKYPTPLAPGKREKAKEVASAGEWRWKSSARGARRSSCRLRIACSCAEGGGVGGASGRPPRTSRVAQRISLCAALRPAAAAGRGGLPLARARRCSRGAAAGPARRQDASKPLPARGKVGVGEQQRWLGTRPLPMHQTEGQRRVARRARAAPTTPRAVLPSQTQHAPEQPHQPCHVLVAGGRRVRALRSVCSSVQLKRARLLVSAGVATAAAARGPVHQQLRAQGQALQVQWRARACAQGRAGGWWAGCRAGEREARVRGAVRAAGQAAGARALRSSTALQRRAARRGIGLQTAEPANRQPSNQPASQPSSQPPSQPRTLGVLIPEGVGSLQRVPALGSHLLARGSPVCRGQVSECVCSAQVKQTVRCRLVSRRYHARAARGPAGGGRPGSQRTHRRRRPQLRARPPPGGSRRPAGRRAPQTPACRARTCAAGRRRTAWYEWTQRRASVEQAAAAAVQAAGAGGYLNLGRLARTTASVAASMTCDAGACRDGSRSARKAERGWERCQGCREAAPAA